MKSIDMAIGPLQKQREDFEKLEKEHKKSLKKQFGKMFAVLFELHPELEKFSWDQTNDNYDDQAYTFEVGNFYIELDEAYAKKAGLDSNFLIRHKYEGWGYQEQENYDEISLQFEGNLKESLEKIVKEIWKMTVFLKGFFGQWTNVTATRDGFETKRPRQHYG